VSELIADPLKLNLEHKKKLYTREDLLFLLSSLPAQLTYFMLGARAVTVEPEGEIASTGSILCGVAQILGFFGLLALVGCWVLHKVARPWRMISFPNGPAQIELLGYSCFFVSHCYGCLLCVI
jgi:hypothetical protein